MEATLARLAEHAQNVQNNCGKKAMIINEKRTFLDSRFLNGQKRYRKFHSSAPFSLLNLSNWFIDDLHGLPASVVIC